MTHTLSVLTAILCDATSIITISFISPSHIHVAKEWQCRMSNSSYINIKSIACTI